MACFTFDLQYIKKELIKKHIFRRQNRRLNFNDININPMHYSL